MTKHPASPLDDDIIDAFLDSPKKRHTLMNGSDTSRMAWRILKKLYYDRRDLRGKLAELEGTRLGGSETNWTTKVEGR
jgi:hypothetical protein